MKRIHIISLISILLGSFALAHSMNLFRTKAAGPAPQSSADARAYLDQTVSAQAAGRGKPWITLRDGHAAPAQYEGSAKLAQQLKDNQLRPLSAASADFDEDGVPDIVSGYGA